MKRIKLEDLDFSFLPPHLAKERKEKLEKVLKSLKNINWPIKAIVLGGGYKHKELTSTKNSISSDIDLYIFSDFLPFFWKKLLKTQKELNQPDYFFHYRGVIPFFLKKSKTFWAYRLKKEGIVLAGDKNILQKIQAKTDNLSKIEAIRILFQNLVVWLKLAEISLSREKISSDLILRSYLNIGESYLVFAGKLAPSYKERLGKIEEVVREFNLEKELIEKIKAGYRAKIIPSETKKEKISLSKAKKDCLAAINHLFFLYLKKDVSLENKLDILGREIKPKWLFNLVFFWSLRNLKEVKPKFFPIIFQFKITDLWKMSVYYEKKEKEKLFKILEKYFSIKKFSDIILIRFFEFYPFSSLIEIN